MPDPKVCKPCFQGLHCKSDYRPTECECPCGELHEPKVATVAEWLRIEAANASIRAKMRAVEQIWYERQQAEGMQAVRPSWEKPS